MGNLVFQAASGGQVALSGPNTASSFTIAVPAISGTLVTTGDTGTVTTTMLASTTGSGAVVLATSPTLVTPILGTPTSVTLTNATGLPNGGLVNSTITIGGTSIALGGSSSAISTDITISGLTVGKGAGAVSTNTAVGASALSSGSLSGAYNTGVGYQTLQANTTGSSNSAFGLQSLVANTTGYNNSAYGAISLYANTTGVNNTAIGEEALRTNTTASNNTAVGYQAGYSNTDQANNVFIGYQSGYANTAGYRQTFVGTNSGNAITTGVKNTIIGGYTGNQSGLDIRTASNYIVLSDGDGNPRGIFDPSSRLLVGCTATDSGAQFRFQYGSGQNGLQLFDNSGASGSTFVIFGINSGGNSNIGSIARVAATAAIVYNTTSDYRLKNVVGVVTDQGARIDALKPIDYQWKEGNIPARGFLAHEFQTIYPNSVTGDKDAVDANGKPKYQSMQAATSEVIADLVAEIQSLRKRISTLENK
jgi:hypothetical protein